MIKWDDLDEAEGQRLEALVGPPAYPILDAPDNEVRLYSDLSRLPVYHVASEPRAIYLPVKVGDKDLVALWDTGSSLSQIESAVIQALEVGVAPYRC